MLRIKKFRDDVLIDIGREKTTDELLHRQETAITVQRTLVVDVPTHTIKVKTVEHDLEVRVRDTHLTHHPPSIGETPSM